MNRESVLKKNKTMFEKVLDIRRSSIYANKEKGICRNTPIYLRNGLESNQLKKNKRETYIIRGAEIEILNYIRSAEEAQRGNETRVTGKPGKTFLIV